MVLVIPGYRWPYIRLVVEGIVFPHDGCCPVVGGCPPADLCPQGEYGPEVGGFP
jgi:hypothetical protein